MRNMKRIHDMHTCRDVLYIYIHTYAHNIHMFQSVNCGILPNLRYPTNIFLSLENRIAEISRLMIIFLVNLTLLVFPSLGKPHNYVNQSGIPSIR